MPLGRRIACIALLLSATILGGATQAIAQNGVAPDVVIIAEPTLKPALTAVGEAWQAKTGFPVHVFGAPTWQILEQIAHGIRCDIVVGEGGAALADALARKLVKSDRQGSGWRNRLVVAKHAGGAAPIILARDSNLVGLAGGGPIAIVDPPVSSDGVFFQKALTSLGLWDGLQAHAVGTDSTAEAVYRLVHNKATLALVYATDIVARPGLAVAATVPDDAYPPIVYWRAEAGQAYSPKTDAFFAFLGDPAAQAALRAAGLEVPK